MISVGRSLALSLGVVLVASCSPAPKSSADTSAVAAAPAAAAPNAAADESAIRDLNASWFRIYNRHDAAVLAALYADDAVLMMPGYPEARGRAAIQAAYQRDMDSMTKAGYMNNQGTNSEIGVSGDVAWESNSFNITDKAGKKIDAGKYVTVFARKDGKWAIIRDIWNSDAGTPTP